MDKGDRPMKRKPGDIVEALSGGGYIRKPYERCPLCGGAVDWQSCCPEIFGDDPPLTSSGMAANEVQECVGYLEDDGADPLGPEPDGCGWQRIMEHRPAAPGRSCGR